MCLLCLSLSFHSAHCFAMTVSDQLKNSRLASSSSSQLKHLLSSSLPSSGSMHHQDPLEAALLAAARGQHGAGIPGNVFHENGTWMAQCYFDFLENLGMVYVDTSCNKLLVICWYFTKIKKLSKTKTAQNGALAIKWRQSLAFWRICWTKLWPLFLLWPITVFVYFLALCNVFIVLIKKLATFIMYQAT